MLFKFYIKERHNLLKIVNFLQFLSIYEIYVTNFAQSWFWWIANCGFNIIKRIFIRILVQVDPHVDLMLTHVDLIG